MTPIQLKHGPFAQKIRQPWKNGPTYTVTCGVVDRIALVRASTDKEWLGHVIRHHETEKTVCTAAERRWYRLP